MFDMLVFLMSVCAVTKNIGIVLLIAILCHKETTQV